MIQEAVGGVAGVAELPGDLGDLRGSAGLAPHVGDVAEVAEGAREVAVLDRGGQILAAAAAHGVDEVRVVVGAAFPLLELLALRVERGGFGVARYLQVAALAVDDDADLRTEVLVHAAPAPLVLLRLEVAGQAADLEQQGRALVVVVHELGVRGVAVVDVGEPAADADRPRRQRVLAQRPAGDVHLVDALVAEVAVAGVEHPVPVVVQTLAH